MIDVERRSAETIERIRKIMWPPSDPERQWDADTIEDVAGAASSGPIEHIHPVPVPKVGRPEGPAERALRNIWDMLYPPADPDQPWDADTIESIAWVIEGYDSESPPAPPRGTPAHTRRRVFGVFDNPRHDAARLKRRLT